MAVIDATEEEATAWAAIYFWTHPCDAVKKMPEKEWLAGLVRTIRGKE